MVKRVMSLALALGLSLGVASANIATKDISAQQLEDIVAVAKEAGMTDQQLAEIGAEVIPGVELLANIDPATVVVAVLATGVASWLWAQRAKVPAVGQYLAKLPGFRADYAHNAGTAATADKVTSE